MSIASSSIRSFLEELSSIAPTPGRGGVASLAGALAAGLVGMVCHLASFRWAGEIEYGPLWLYPAPKMLLMYLSLGGVRRNRKGVSGFEFMMFRGLRFRD